jgi:hypothetical protein
MFGKMFEDVVGVAADIAKVAIAPVAIAATVTREVTKPVADAVQDAAEAVQEGLVDKK